MSILHNFSKEAVQEFLKKDRILTFRYRLLMEKEFYAEKDALLNIYENLIVDDPFRYSEYTKILAKLKKNNPKT